MSKPVDRVSPSRAGHSKNVIVIASEGSASGGGRHFRLGRTRTAAAGRALAMVLALGGIGLVAMTAVPSHRQPASPPPMSNGELEVTLLRANISPEALAAAGFTGADTSALVGRARSILAEDIVDRQSNRLTLASRRLASKLDLSTPATSRWCCGPWRR